jgi:hypothetical protein
MEAVAQSVELNSSAEVLSRRRVPSSMSPVALEITLLLGDPAARHVDDWRQEIDRVSDEVEAAVMGIGEVVGYDYNYAAREVTLLVGGEDADRSVSIAVPLVQALNPLPGSFYTVGDADRHEETESPARVSL